MFTLMEALKQRFSYPYFLKNHISPVCQLVSKVKTYKIKRTEIQSTQSKQKSTHKLGVMADMKHHIN